MNGTLVVPSCSILYARRSAGLFLEHSLGVASSRCKVHNVEYVPTGDCSKTKSNFCNSLNIGTAVATYKELLAQREQLDAEIARRRSQERIAVIAEILRKIADYHVDLHDLSGGTLGGAAKGRKDTARPAKYRDPRSGKEWSGRGKPPNWIRYAEDRKKFEVKT
ncbi:H-NS histone family protein [Paraburkholderia tropica]|uniref:H-NS histone family protein n=1 Tax=Paraburkholderia tropica TaxID=92647 RepID=UPI001FC8C089|nr:H-NS histone family protein [Paraburkholderia tropica]